MAAPPDYRSDIELLDPKTETFDEVKKLVAALWVGLPPADRDRLAGMLRVLDWTAERVTPFALFDNADGLTSDAFLAHQRVEIEVASSSQTYTDSVRALYFTFGRFLTLKRFPPNLAFARRFFRDRAFRLRQLEGVTSRDVAAYFTALDETVRQTIEAFLRRLEHALAFPEIRCSIGMPPEAIDRLVPPRDARLTIGNFGPGNRLPLGKALERASHRLIDLLRTLPRRDPSTPFLLILEEAAVLLSQAGELAEPLANASRTLRAFNVGVQLAAQDFANALPKTLVRTLLLNARWVALFQSREEAEWLAPFAEEMPAHLGTATQRRTALVKEIQNLPPRHAYLHVKGSRPVRFQSLPVPNAAERCGRADAELLALFDREITPRSTVAIQDAEDAIAAWEAGVIGPDPGASSGLKTATRPRGISELLASYEDEDAP